MHKPRYRISVIITSVYLTALLLIAFWPTPVDRPISGGLSQVIRWLHAHGMPRFIGYDSIEFAANIAFFVPLGFIFASWMKKTWVALLGAFLTSLFVEFGQAAWLPNRYPSVFDIIANSLGALLGVGILLAERRWRSRKAGTSAALQRGDAADVVDPNPAGLSEKRAAEHATSDLREKADSPRTNGTAGVAESRRSRGSAIWTRRRKILTISGMALSLILAACLGAAVQATLSDKATSSVIGSSAKPSPDKPTASPGPASPAPVPSPSTTPPANKPIVAFIGDDYTVGVGATTQASRWVEKLANHEGWSLRNMGYRNTGYASYLHGEAALTACGREHCPRYGELIEPLRALHPDIVVVSGGRNDVWHGATAPAEIDRFYRQLREALPKTKIVAVAPVWDASPPPESLPRLAQQIKTSALAVGATVVDIGQPLQGKPERVVSTGQHPSDAGHQAIADSIAAELKNQRQRGSSSTGSTNQS